MGAQRKIRKNKWKWTNSDQRAWDRGWAASLAAIMDRTPCPECGDTSNADVEGHKGSPYCRSRKNTNAARAEGLVECISLTGGSIKEIDEEILIPIREACLVEWRDTGFFPGGSRGQRDQAVPPPIAARHGINIPRDARADVISMPWVPVWAVEASMNALDAGDDQAAALLIYRQALSDCPEIDVANSMLGDARLLER